MQDFQKKRKKEEIEEDALGGEGVEEGGGGRETSGVRWGGRGACSPLATLLTSRPLIFSCGSTVDPDIWFISSLLSFFTILKSQFFLFWNLGF